MYVGFYPIKKKLWAGIIKKKKSLWGGGDLCAYTWAVDTMSWKSASDSALEKWTALIENSVIFESK